MTSWTYCSCVVKPDVLKLIILTKRKLLAGQFVPMFTTVELSLIIVLAFIGGITVIFGAVACYIKCPLFQKLSEINEMPKETQESKEESTEDE